VRLLGDGEALGLEVAEPTPSAATSRLRERAGSRLAQRASRRDGSRSTPADRQQPGRAGQPSAPGWGPLLETLRERTARS
jgi:hypothetical protein